MQEMTDYRVYMLSRGQQALAVALGALIAFVASYLFYRSVIVALLCAASGLLMPRWWRAILAEQRRQRLRLQFKEALVSLTSSLAAGRSVENAFRTLADDLQLIYPDPKTDILREFTLIRIRLDNGESLEPALRDFSERAGIEDITNFVDVFATGKRTGGDLVEIIRSTAQTIGEKLDIQLEIAVMIAQKKFESRIMMAIPFIFLGFLAAAAPDYMEPLYASPIGYVLLTVCLGLLSLCYWFMIRLMSIRI
ncbi:type II secretion system F family protein [Paenibacillus daejeonensis]|uniref:type II secretion system F family protein n=1 Tax=Paenibacillus daejeonensis TaxID=135193 RepID=UPI000379FC45|nr:type II secretion system F family protein [Paenibacillus daejeonensis]